MKDGYRYDTVDERHRKQKEKERIDFFNLEIV